MRALRPGLSLGLACALLPFAACYSSYGLSSDGVADAGRDAGSSRDAAASTSCAPDDARAIVCPSFVCDDVGAWQWNGDRCFYVACGACEGTDCAAGAPTQAACERNHVGCEACLCRATGGDGLFWAQECGHYECGRPVPAICEVGFAVCDCGLSRSFAPGVGCVPDAACPSGPPVLPREQRCTETGGRWANLCCDSVCGEPCAAACAADACDCGPGRISDEARGCIESSRCFTRTLDEICGPSARCEAETICCQSCGGAGCVGDSRCRAPTCDADPLTDECGNRLDAP